MSSALPSLARSLKEFSGSTLRLFTQAQDLSQGMRVASGVTHTVFMTLTEAGDTTYTATVPIPAGSILEEIEIRSTVLWDDTGAVTLDVGDTADPNGYFAAVDMKATDLLVGQVLRMSNSEYWGGLQGVYLVAATGLNSASYYATASNVTAVITTANQDGSAGRSFMWVRYSTAIARAAVAA